MRMIAEGGETDDLSGYAEATLGGSTIFQEGVGGDPLQTANIRIALRLDAPGVLDFGLAGSHTPGFDPTGTQALGLTSFEAHLRIDPDPHHYGALVRGRIDRVVSLATQVDDVWQGQLQGELYTRLFGVMFGSDTRGGYGQPTGSMGWNPFTTQRTWSAYVGGFLRGEACFSARCESDDSESDP
jgi:hypothetical protein